MIIYYVYIERDGEPPSFFHPSQLGGSCLNGFWKRKHPEGGEGVGQRKRGTAGSSRLFVEREEWRWTGRGQ